MPNIEEAIGAREFHRQKLEKPKNYTEKLKRLMGEISEKINREIEEQYGLYTFLNEDCTISMEGYADSWGGIYKEGRIESDKREVNKLEAKFSEMDPRFGGIQSEKDRVECWRADKEYRKGSQMEMAITALLCKVLGKDFLVVRTATYDDYTQGADYIILNKRTGEVICAFDAFSEEEGGDLALMKKIKIREIAETGGAEIGYGMRLKDGGIARSKMKNIPVLSLGLNSQDLAKLLGDMSFDSKANATPTEYEIFFKLRTSLREQQKRLLASPNTSPEVKKRLVAFKTSLAMMERIGQEIH